MHKLSRRLDFRYEKLRLQIYALIDLINHPSERQKLFKSKLDNFEFSKREMECIKVFATHGHYDYIYQIFNK